MILADNISILKRRTPHIFETLKENEPYFKSQPMEVVSAVNGMANIKLKFDNRDCYLHSRYNPQYEAEQWVSQYTVVDESSHVFFVGVGLGYHIEAFQKKFPHVSFSIFEPNPAIFYHFICTRNLAVFSNKRWSNLYIGETQQDMHNIAANFANNIKDSVLFIIHPTYERMFKEETIFFSEKVKEQINSKKSSLQVNVHYEQLWSLNSALNFRKVLETPSMLREMKSHFEGKPVILAAAGPSLQEEFENLRYIKANGLAYIFAVGSANRALINQGIMPDAVTSYDPNVYNHQVFEEIINQRIDTVPLIFGSSVGYETVQKYPGPMLHMITSQDTIAPFYISQEGLKQKNEVISDAPSIAVLTLELLAKLKCSKIILVGQNFGFKNNLYYAQGIQYGERTQELTEKEQRSSLFVENVDGEKIATSEGINMARLQMERYIEAIPSDIEIINTTTGGAKIQGTKFIHLSEVISDMLMNQVVEKNWYQKTTETSYDMSFIAKQAHKMENEYIDFNNTFKALIKLFKKIDEYAALKNSNQILKTLPKFDKLIKDFLNNKYYLNFIQSPTRVQYEFFQKSILSVRNAFDPIEKSKLIIQVFGKYVYECRQAHYMLEPHYQAIQDYLMKAANDKNPA